MASKKREWTKDDLKLMKAEFPTTPVEKLARKMKRTPGALRQKAFAMGLRKRGKKVATKAKPKTKARTKVVRKPKVAVTEAAAA